MWELPNEDLLAHSAGIESVQDRADELLEILADLGATCNLASATVAPQVVRYELDPCAGIRMKAFHGIEEDLMQQLGLRSIRIEAPTPGARTVGIELPRTDRAMVHLGDLPQRGGELAATIAVDVEGEPLTIDIAALPHLLIAGQSGGGKSVTLHAVLCSLLMQKTPDELEIVIIDPKMVEGAAYEDLPHATVVYDPSQAVKMLRGAVSRMEMTYKMIKDNGCRNLEELNELLAIRGELPIPRRLIVIDEAADLVMQAKGAVESAMIRLGQKGRAAGFHVILATQSPRAQVVTGMLKANLTGRLALNTASALDSRIIMDQSGAEDLLGKGDFLYNDGASMGTTRAQSAFVDREEVAAIVDHWARQYSPVMA